MKENLFITFLSTCLALEINIIIFQFSYFVSKPMVRKRCIHYLTINFSFCSPHISFHLCQGNMSERDSRFFVLSIFCALENVTIFNVRFPAFSK